MAYDLAVMALNDLAVDRSLNTDQSNMKDEEIQTFDAMILCDDKDVENYDVLLPFEEIEQRGNLTFCYEYDGKEPGRDFCQYISEMKDRVKCIVFYVTNNYCENEHLIRITQALEKCNKGHICVLRDSNINLEEHLCFLTGTIIYQSEGNWQQNVQQEVELLVAKCPSFYKKFPTKFVSDDLLEKGMNTIMLKWDVYGIIVQIGEKTLEIDLERFIEHLEQHKIFKTHQVCASCSSLCTLDTSVVLVLNNKTDIFNVPEFDEALTKFSSVVLDVIQGYNEDTIWTLLCTTKGETLDKPGTLNKLFAIVYYSLANKCIHFLDGTYCYPEYADLQMRKESFSGKWQHNRLPSVDKLSKAGFFFSECHKSTLCFHCRTCITDWKANDDPWICHAYTCPFCPYVKANMTQEEIEDAKELKKHDKDNHKYDTIEDRVKSFEVFDIRHLKNSESITDKDRDLIIQTISKAGFHYFGRTDIVVCSFCNLALSMYQADDTFELLHAKLSPACKFVLQKYGKSGVDIVLRTAKLESQQKNKGRAMIEFRIRTLDKEPKRNLPSNLFSPPRVSE